MFTQEFIVVFIFSTFSSFTYGILSALEIYKLTEKCLKTISNKSQKLSVNHDFFGDVIILVSIFLFYRALKILDVISLPSLVIGIYGTHILVNTAKKLVRSFLFFWLDVLFAVIFIQQFYTFKLPNCQVSIFI